MNLWKMVKILTSPVRSSDLGKSPTYHHHRTAEIHMNGEPMEFVGPLKVGDPNCASRNPIC